MPSLTALVRSLGNDRAVDNVRAALERRQREDWLIVGLASRLDQRALAAVSTQQVERQVGTG